MKFADAIGAPLLNGNSLTQSDPLMITCPEVAHNREKHWLLMELGKGLTATAKHRDNAFGNVCLFVHLPTF